MGLSKERKIFLGVFGVAATALIVDQGLLGPRAAGADVVIPDAQADPIAAVLGGEAQGMPGAVSLSHIAARLRSAAFSDSSPTDAFAIPVSWSPSEPVPAAESGSRAEASNAALSLTAVMPSSSGGVAVINGSAVRVGGRVVGTDYRLVEVTSGTAVLAHAGGTHVLNMPLKQYMPTVRSSASGE